MVDEKSVVSSPLTPLDLQEIRKRCELATPGPWHWERGYELVDEYGRTQKHWGLKNPADPNRVTNGYLVTHTSSERDISGENRLCDTPDFQFIAHARSDVPALVAECQRLREALDGLVNWKMVRDYDAAMAKARELLGEDSR